MAPFDFKAHQLEEAYLRQKIYRIRYLDLLEDFCRETVIELIGPQMDKVDADGFLAEDYWSGSTHATPAYYDRVGRVPRAVKRCDASL